MPRRSRRCRIRTIPYRAWMPTTRRTTYFGRRSTNSSVLRVEPTMSARWSLDATGRKHRHQTHRAARTRVDCKGLALLPHAMADDPRPPALRDDLRRLWVQALVAEVRRRLTMATDGSLGGPARCEAETSITRIVACEPPQRVDPVPTGRRPGRLASASRTMVRRRPTRSTPSPPAVEVRR